MRLNGLSNKTVNILIENSINHMVCNEYSTDIRSN